MTKSLFRAELWLSPFLLCCSAPKVMAEENNRESKQQEQVQVTATRRAATSFEVAAAVTVVNADEIEAETPDVLAEMLRGLPGTYFQQTTAGQGIPIIRGLKGSQVLHMVDGMRLNNAFFRSAPNQYLGLVDPYMTASIDVVRGASGTLYGADAMGGVVNIRTYEPQPGLRGKRGTAYGGYNSVDSGWVSHASLEATNRSTGLMVAASHQDRGDRTTGSGETLTPSGFRSTSVNTKLVHEAGEHVELMFQVQMLEQPSTPRTDELIAGFGQSGPASTEFEFEPNKRKFVHGRLRHDNPARFIDSLEIHLARQVIEDDRRTLDSGAQSRTIEQNQSTLDGFTIQMDRNANSGTHWTWGAEFYQDEVRSARQSQDITSGEHETVRSRFPDRSQMDSAAAYVSASWKPHERVNLDTGLRYSSFRIALPETADTNSARLNPNDISGNIQAVFSLNPNLNLVANAGRGFRPPNVFDLGTLGNRPGNRFNTANPELSPETVWSYDLGLKYSGDQWRSEVFLFQMDYEDKITSVETGGTTDQGRIIVRSENRNSVKLNGLEAGFSWFAGERMTINGVINFTRGTERDGLGSPEPADRIPPVNGRFGIQFEATEQWRFDTWLGFASRQDRLSGRDLRDSRINPEGTPGWVSVNAAVQWQATPDLLMGLKLENISDKSYREHASGIDAPGFNIGIWARASF